MSVSRRSRFTVVAAGLAGVALIAALVIGLNPRGAGPLLAAPGADHASVSAEDSANGPVAMGNGNSMGAARKHDTSKPLRELKQYPAHPLPAKDGEGDQEADGGRPGPHAADTVVQSSPATPAMPATTLSFDGIGFPGVGCNCAPPDTNGEVGATQYVQIVNEGYQVFEQDDRRLASSARRHHDHLERLRRRLRDRRRRRPGGALRPVRRTAG